MPYKDKEKQRAAWRKWRNENKEADAEKGRLRAQQAREYVAKIKDKSECLYCPEHENCCLDFHHFRDKKYVIANMVSGGYSLKTIQEEIDKCIIVCSNCHRKIHNGLI